MNAEKLPLTSPYPYCSNLSANSLVGRNTLENGLFISCGVG